jgi:signal transduction histidine kinase
MRSIGEVRLENPGTPEEYRDTIGSMLEEVNRLTSIVENLLILSRADAGQIQLHVSIFPLVGLVREAASLLEVLIVEKNLLFTLEGDENIGVQADRLYVRQAIVNVLHNAVKFTPEGGSIEARVTYSGHSLAELSIRDSGPGISEAHAAKIFNRFYRIDDARERHDGGAGLGLSIAKWAVQANNGEIGVANSEGHGSTFWIRLPVVGCPSQTS